MILGNFLIFIAVIVIICSIDLSTITLDEATERLMYANSDEPVAKETAASKDKSEKTTKKADKSADAVEPNEPVVSVLEPDDEDFQISDDVLDDITFNEVAPDKVSSPIENLKNDGKPISPLVGASTSSSVSSQSLDIPDDIGMHEDFADNLDEANDFIGYIYEKGGVMK